MAIRTRVRPINRAAVLTLCPSLDPRERSKILARYANKVLAEAQAQNAKAIGQTPEHETFVDGARGADVENVKPEGTIVFQFQLIQDVLSWINKMLLERSPVKSGRYKRSHILLADGVEVDPSSADFYGATEFVFTNLQPYSRKIERGKSKQAPLPDAVYQGVAAMASNRFGNIAKITFSFRALAGREGGGRKIMNISRIGPLEVKRSKNGRFLKGSHTRAGNAKERDLRQPAIVITR